MAILVDLGSQQVLGKLTVNVLWLVTVISLYVRIFLASTGVRRPFFFVVCFLVSFVKVKIKS